MTLRSLVRAVFQNQPAPRRSEGFHPRGFWGALDRPARRPLVSVPNVGLGAAYAQVALTIAIAVTRDAARSRAAVPINESFMNATAPGWVFGAICQSNFTPASRAPRGLRQRPERQGGWPDRQHRADEREAGYAFYDRRSPRAGSPWTSSTCHGGARRRRESVSSSSTAASRRDVQDRRAGRLVWVCGRQHQQSSAARAVHLGYLASPSTSTATSRPPTAASSE